MPDLDQDIEEIGNRLGIMKEEIRAIKRRKLKQDLLYPISGFLVVVCSTLLGWFTAKSQLICVNCSAYPYAAAVGFKPLSKGDPLKRNDPAILPLIVTLLVSVAGFAAAYLIAQKTFGIAIEYNVYRRK